MKKTSIIGLVIAVLIITNVATFFFLRGRTTVIEKIVTIIEKPRTGETKLLGVDADKNKGSGRMAGSYSAVPDSIEGGFYGEASYQGGRIQAEETAYRTSAGASAATTASQKKEKAEDSTEAIPASGGVVSGYQMTNIDDLYARELANIPRSGGFETLPEPEYAPDDEPDVIDESEIPVPLPKFPLTAMDFEVQVEEERPPLDLALPGLPDLDIN